VNAWHGVLFERCQELNIEAMVITRRGDEK